MTLEQRQTGKLAPLFDGCRRDDRAALIGYLPTGYPDVPTSVAAMTALVESGCDLIEVGVPYSDPGMDGPTIAATTEARCTAVCGCATRWPRSRRSARPAAARW
ncbi:Tryptophan synthase alpha chain [Mycobacterium talmoniae]|uniref:tryptophan synthase n=1 Tax=Mycobacterium talmoniae TaxID=1858794 RepID=A0A2S8BPM9_9MYCO|nr:Tryptophan synthase alpha chain [Mycobacterium talmoniae]